MEVDAFGPPHHSTVNNAIIGKEVAYFNRLYYSMYLGKKNTTMDPIILEEHQRMLLGTVGASQVISLPSPQKKRSISETSDTTTTTQPTIGSSKQNVNTPPPLKKKKVVNNSDEEKKTPKVKVYTTTLFEKGLLASGDIVLFKHEDKEIECKVNNHGDLEVENADKTDRRISNNLRIITQFILEAYKLSNAGKSKYWNLYYLVTKKGTQIKFRTLRERYLALLEQESQKGKKGEDSSKRKKRIVEESNKKNARVLISQLVQSGLLKDGATVIYRGQKNTFSGKITDSKYITYHDEETNEDEHFETPNSFKSHIGELGNCWQQMVVKNGQEETSFKTLRDRYFD